MTNRLGEASPADIAKAIVFAHPSLQALDAEAAQRVETAIAAPSSGLGALATAISSQGQASTNGGWATVVAIGSIGGQPAQALQISGKTLSATVGPLVSVIAATQNDPKLENLLWFPVTTATGGYQPAPTRTGYDWTITDLGTPFGVAITEVSADIDSGAWSVSLSNGCPSLRGLYVEFLDESGAPLAAPDWQSRLPAAVDARFESITRKYIALLPPAIAIEGVASATDPVQVTFTAPDGTSSVRLICGGVGRQGWDPELSGLGTGVSALLGYALANLLLQAGVAAPDQAYLELLARDDLIEEAMQASGFLLEAGDADAAYAALVEQLGPLIYSGGLPKLTAALLELASAAALATAAEAVSWNLATLALTNGSNGPFTGDPLSAPGTFDKILFPGMVGKATVTLSPDPASGVWPASAKKATVTARVSGTEETRDSAVSGIATGTVSVSFDAIPANRAISFTAAVTDADTNLVATGAGSSTAVYGPRAVSSLSLNDAARDLGVGTRFVCAATLAYDSKQGHCWVEGQTPTATLKDLDAGSTGHNLAALGGLSVASSLGLMGYVWQASGQNLPFCGSSDPTSGQIQALQTLSCRAHPESGLETPACGFSARTLLVFDQDGRGFYLDPRDGMYLRGFVPGEAFDMDKATSWGRFPTTRLDDLIIHPAGYAVGVSFHDDAVVSVRLEQATDAQAPVAGAVGGSGDAAGRFAGPVALDLAPDGALLVLEAVNQRIQAVDVRGNPVGYFPGGQPLLSLDAGATYLDLAVDAEGYLLVLYYTGDGDQPDDYAVELRAPDGTSLARNSPIPAARIAIDPSRTLFSLGYGKLLGPGGRTEPCVSVWVPV